jgi:hypothetical protein
MGRLFMLASPTRRMTAIRAEAGSAITPTNLFQPLKRDKPLSAPQALLVVPDASGAIDWFRSDIGFGRIPRDQVVTSTVK